LEDHLVPPYGDIYLIPYVTSAMSSRDLSVDIPENDMGKTDI
jgi:hypothetical protein